ncbi:MAG: hypothetical protein GY855_11855 [candidate division Zixibacteria bacterium]|nr:hypothetical protein [candidate division Zixibacteria bacterium]
MKDSKSSRIIKTAAILALLYLFLVSIQLMGDSFKLFGKGFAEALISGTSHPFAGLVIGILATSIAQSSSLTTSIVVGVVAGGALTIENAIPIIFGANIGTSVTNTVVSIAHIGRSKEFKKAFAASTVHDFFNLITVIILFPIQITTDFLGKFVSWFSQMFAAGSDVTFNSPVKAIVKPFAHLILNIIGKHPVIALIVAIVLLFFSLRYMMKIMSGVVLSKVEGFFGKYIFKTPVRAIMFGMIVTIIVQSSSVTTSIAVPLAAAGILSLQQIFPYTMGSNIGTTITAFMAALATGSIPALAVALAHLIFNVLGCIIVWPIRFIPIWLAEKLAEISTKNKIIPIAYVLVTFFGLPLLLMYFFG